MDRRRQEILVVSGNRDLAPEYEPLVTLETLDAAAMADEIRIGGALGVDTVALKALCGEENVSVYVPFTLADQPPAARRAIESCAADIRELRLPHSKRAYLDRNQKMLEGASRLLAFTDGRETGGTAYTINLARRMGIPVSVVQIGEVESAFAGAVFPESLPAPVFYYEDYAPGSKATEFVKLLKRGDAPASAIEWAAGKLQALIEREPELASAGAIAPLPRRAPGADNDLLPLAEVLGGMAGKDVLDGWLLRAKEPGEGVIRARRMRNTQDQHFDSLRLGYRAKYKRVILLDNVLMFGGTLGGAMHRVLADSRIEPVGLAILKGSGL